jgi:hypothetical protein
MSPFDPALLNHNEAQLDFILQMYVRDHPRGPLQIERPGAPRIINPETQWADVLTGTDYERYMAKQMPPEAVLQRLRGLSRSPDLNPSRPPPGNMPKPTG